MNKYLKIITLIFLVINVGLVFADNEWIVFPTENKNIYPIIFGKIEDPNGLINCTGNLIPSKFYPGQNTAQINVTSNCKNTDGGIIFYIRNKDTTTDVQSLVAKDFLRYYFISSSLRFGEEDQNISLAFPFKQS